MLTIWGGVLQIYLGHLNDKLTFTAEYDTGACLEKREEL